MIDLLLVAIVAPLVVWLVLALVLNCCEFISRVWHTWRNH